MSSPLVAVPSPRHPHLHHPRGKSPKPWSSCVWPHSSWGKKKKARTTHQYLIFFRRFVHEILLGDVCVFSPLRWFKLKRIQYVFFCKGKVISKEWILCVYWYIFSILLQREIIGKQRDGQTSLTWSDLWVATSEGHPEIEKKKWEIFQRGVFKFLPWVFVNYTIRQRDPKGLQSQKMMYRSSFPRVLSTSFSPSLFWCHFCEIRIGERLWSSCNLHQ